MWPIQIFISCGFLLHGGTICTQTFNIRTHDLQQTSFQSVTEFQDTFLVTGWTYDTTGGFYPKLTALALDPFGEELFYKNYGTLETPLNPTSKNISHHESLCMAPTVILLNDTTMFAHVCLLNSQGDTISTITFDSPYSGGLWESSNWVVPHEAVIDEFGNCYSAVQLVYEQYYQGPMFVKYNDSFTGFEWQYFFQNIFNYNLCTALNVHEGRVYAATKTHLSWAEFYEYTATLSVFNDEGELIAEWPENLSANFMYYTDIAFTNNLVVLCGPVSDFFESTYIPAVRVLTISGEEIWAQTYGPFHPYDYRTFHAMAIADDGNIVCMGKFHDFDPPDPEVNGDDNEVIRLVKIDISDGDIIWERHFSYVQSIWDSHDARALINTSDGGFLFCGEATDSYYLNPDIELPIQQGWVVKVDECGCLVPGCDPDCKLLSVGDEEFDASMLLGPNPASASINIWINQELVQHANQLAIYNSLGQLVLQTRLSPIAQTVMLDIHDWEVGTYILSVSNDSEVVSTKKFIKQ